MDVTTWKLIVAIAVVGTLCGREHSARSDDRVDNGKAAFNDGPISPPSPNNSGPEDRPTPSRSALPDAPGVTFEEVVPASLFVSIVRGSAALCESRCHYLGNDEAWHYLALGESDRVLVASVDVINGNVLGQAIVEQKLKESFLECLDWKSRHELPVSDAVQTFCDSRGALTKALPITAVADNENVMRDDGRVALLHPRHEGLSFILVAPDHAFYSLLQENIDGLRLGNVYVGYDSDFHYIADEWAPIIWCCAKEQIAQEDLTSALRRQREQQDAFWAIVSEGDLDIPFASRPEQRARREWLASHKLVRQAAQDVPPGQSVGDE